MMNQSIYTNMSTVFFDVVIGISAFMALINTLQYFVNKDKAYLLYAVYLVSHTFNTYQLVQTKAEQITIIATVWEITFVQRLTIIAYFAFSVAFFQFEIQNERVLKIWRQAIYLFTFFLFIELIVALVDGNNALLWWFQHNFTIVRFAFSFYCIYNIRYLQSPLRSFYLTGTVLLWIGVLISKAFPSAWIQHDVLYLNPFFYTLFFTVIEIACFTIGLSYRSNFLLLQKQKQIDQERLEKEQMRNHIAADLHDDMGAGLSTIRLLGTRAQLSTDGVEKNKQIQKITAQANDLIEKMSTIIWAMNSEKDTIENLLQYIRYYAFDYLKDTHNLNLQFPLPDLPPSVLAQNLSGDDRREVFLTVKEALHNIVKHAEATTATMSIVLKNKNLEMLIGDNGIGLNEKNALGNGLNNMAKRMDKMGGSFQILNAPMGGTHIVLGIPLTKVRG